MFAETPLDRRELLKAIAATGVTYSLGWPALGQDAQEMMPVTAPADAPPPAESQKLRLAYIGTGGIGNWHREKTAELGVVCPCYCDVDTNRMDKISETFPDAARYQDYRKMFDERHADFDAVMIGTPDHHHYPATKIAMQLGKHVYTQKPLTHTVWEARELTRAAQRYPVVTQMGNQGHALEGWRLVYEWIRGGHLGDIETVWTWSDRPIWPQGMNRPEEEKQSAPPPHVDWEAWVGPAPMRPYVEKAYHPFAWRGWWDFGCGALGDMACHMMDGIFWALEPGHPTLIEPLAAAETTGEAFPTASVVRWSFPANDWRPGFKAYWYDGGLIPSEPSELEPTRDVPKTGNLFVGTKATLMVAGDYGNSPRIVPEEKMREVGKPQQMLERSPGHVEEWVSACKGEQPRDFPKSNFGYAGPFTESILLGCVALRAQRRLEWDGEAMSFPNYTQADQWLTKEYREGWRV